MAKTRTRTVEVTDAQGRRVQAELVACADCGAEGFIVYWIEGQWLHLQCRRCGTSYCFHEGEGCSG